MPKFVLAYHGQPEIDSKEAGQAHMQAWIAWRDGLGAAVVDPGHAVGPSKTLSAQGVQDGGGSNPISGVTILEADDFDAAIAMVQPCPHLSGTGTIEIAQALDMDM